jgi:hypothetical protein
MRRKIVRHCAILAIEGLAAAAVYIKSGGGGVDFEGRTLAVDGGWGAKSGHEWRRVGGTRAVMSKKTEVRVVTGAERFVAAAVTDFFIGRDKRSSCHLRAVCCRNTARRASSGEA